MCLAKRNPMASGKPLDEVSSPSVLQLESKGWVFMLRRYFLVPDFMSWSYKTHFFITFWCEAVVIWSTFFEHFLLNTDGHAAPCSSGGCFSRLWLLLTRRCHCPVPPRDLGDSSCGVRVSQEAVSAGQAALHPGANRLLGCLGAAGWPKLALLSSCPT